MPHKSATGNAATETDPVTPANKTVGTVSMPMTQKERNVSDTMIADSINTTVAKTGERQRGRYAIQMQTYKESNSAAENGSFGMFANCYSRARCTRSCNEPMFS